MSLCSLLSFIIISRSIQACCAWKNEVFHFFSWIRGRSWNRRKNVKRVNFRKISEIWDHSITGQCTINLGKLRFIWKCMSWPWNIFFSKAKISMNFIQKEKERKISLSWEVDSRHCFLHLRSFGYLLPSFRFGKTHGQ